MWLTFFFVTGECFYHFYWWIMKNWTIVLAWTRFDLYIFLSDSLLLYNFFYNFQINNCIYCKIYWPTSISLTSRLWLTNTTHEEVAEYTRHSYKSVTIETAIFFEKKLSQFPRYSEYLILCRCKIKSSKLHFTSKYHFSSIRIIQNCAIGPDEPDN